MIHRSPLAPDYRGEKMGKTVRPSPFPEYPLFGGLRFILRLRPDRQH
jgi:hypothetical protein